MKSQLKQYDYIIAGTGAAGLSLLCYILSHHTLKMKRILLIDRDLKDKNDRTWCFWDRGNSPFDSCLKKTWNKLSFHSPGFTRLLEIAPYQYKMLDSLSFYTYCFNLIKDFPQVQFIQDTLLDVDAEQGIVNCKEGNYQATYIFNSIFYPRKVPAKHHLLQHFKGIYIQTTQPVFNPEEATLMDFRVEQDQDCRFMYVLPISANEALVEYTGFSESALAEEIYDREILHYLKHCLKINEFDITHEEMGSIPMTDAEFSPGEHRLINIGTAGGATKASTGYTFSFIQKQCTQIVANLAAQRNPLAKQRHSFNKYKFYDSIFLKVLTEKKIPARSVFHALFSKLPASIILAFLDEESTLWEDIRLMYVLDKKIFISAALRNF